MAVEELVQTVLHPTVPFRLPRPTAPLVHPTILNNEILLETIDPAIGLEGVISVRQDLDRHIEIHSPNAGVNVTGGSVTSFVNMDETPRAMATAQRYAQGFALNNASGAVIATSAKYPVRKDEGSIFLWDPVSKQFEDGYVSIMKVALNTGLHSLEIDYQENGSNTVNPGGGTFLVYNMGIDEAGEAYIISTALTVTTVSGTHIYAATFGSVGPYVAFVYVPAADKIYHSMRVNISAVSVFYTGVVTIVHPIASSQAYRALRTDAEKYCMSAFDALLSFEGGMTSAGHVSCALLPFGKNLPTDAEGAIDVIKNMPGKRMYSGSMKEGAHVSWFPDNINQLYLREHDTFQVQSNVIWFAFKGPAPGNLQAAQLRLTTHANVEWETYDPVYGAKSGKNCGMLMQAIVDTYGTIQPCSGNPSHFKKIADGVRRVVNDPTVRMLASLAVDAGKIILPSLVTFL